jgi:F-type H+-transporting ATPase subunit c
MTKKNAMWMLALLVVASPMIFAQAADPADTSAIAQAHAQWKAIAACFSMAIASGMCGLAQAKAVAASAEGMARNPGAAAPIRFALLLGLVLIESLALYTLVVVFKTAT